MSLIAFGAGALAAAALAVAFPARVQRAHDLARKAVAWARAMPRQGPAE